jgi:hypothetical protein
VQKSCTDEYQRRTKLNIFAKREHVKNQIYMPRGYIKHKPPPPDFGSGIYPPLPNSLSVLVGY